MSKSFPDEKVRKPWQGRGAVRAERCGEKARCIQGAKLWFSMAKELSWRVEQRGQR